MSRVPMPKRLEQMGCGRHRLEIRSGGTDRVFACTAPRCPFTAYPGQLHYEETATWYDAAEAARA